MRISVNLIESARGRAHSSCFHAQSERSRGLRGAEGLFAEDPAGAKFSIPLRHRGILRSASGLTGGNLRGSRSGWSLPRFARALVQPSVSAYGGARVQLREKAR
jgi:hypothetical protein